MYDTEWICDSCYKKLLVEHEIYTVPLVLGHKCPYCGNMGENLINTLSKEEQNILLSKNNMKVEITQEQLEVICYFINDWMRLMGFGGEYNKLRMLVRSIAKDNPTFDFSKYYYIKSEL
jgi:hypothetical protein